jgi:hypothetical protein
MGIVHAVRTWSLGRPLIAIVAVAALGAGVALAAVGKRGAAGPVRLTIEANAPGRTIPSGFVGLSTEYWAIINYAGHDPKALDPVFEQLIRNLAPGARPVLRLGGDSTDWTWWPVHGIRKPPGIRYTLTPRWMQIAKALAAATNARVIPGINLEADNRRLAGAEARALLDSLGRRSIGALEIGNEPELYGSFGWYRTKSGREVRGRSRGYGPGAFTKDFSAYARSLPRVPLAGPSTGSPVYLANLSRFLTAERRIGVATVHAYPLKHCEKTTHVTAAQLLSNASSDGLARKVAPLAASAHRHHLPLRIDEINAISCGGERGVSDTYAAALWSLDAMFALARAGVDGVNIHTPPRSINQMITFRDDRGAWSAHVAPIYYGLLAFAEATPPGSRLVPTAGATTPGLSSWATITPDGTLRVVLINKSTRSSRRTELRVRIPAHAPARARPAILQLLRAASLGARAGVTLGGQSFGTWSTTGKLTGASTATSVKASGQRLSVTVPPLSAALLTIPR